MTEELPTAAESFRLGWQEMLDGDTRPIDELWDFCWCDTDTPEDMCTPEDAARIRKMCEDNREILEECW